MAIRFTCPCGQELQARDEHAGRKTRCPKCGAEPVIPGATAESVQSKEDAAPGGGISTTKTKRSNRGGTRLLAPGGGNSAKKAMSRNDDPVRRGQAARR